ncbi:MAG: tetraacyldisaccharide 4'-kinase [Alphaproteobacteria bacterium]
MKTPRFWHRLSLPALLLSPLSLFYLAGATLNRLLTTPEPAALPVISVGNITAGGAGKTPAVLALAELLRSMGEAPHLLTRGYGGDLRTPQEVSTHSDWRTVGDEALLLASAAPTWAGRDRLGSSALAYEHGASLVLADDALQHHRLKKDISLLVIDGAYGLGNWLPLPAGPLRETLPTALKRTDAVILIGEDAHRLAARVAPRPVFHAILEPAGDTGFLREGKWLAFAGLARPQKFFDMLRALGADVVETKSFADHYPYGDADLAALSARAQKLGARLITTAKDAVKLPAGHDVRVLDVALSFTDEADLSDWLRHLLALKRA